MSTSKFYLKLPYKTEVECTIVEQIVPAVSSKVYKQVQKFIEKNCDVKFNEIDGDYLDVHILLGIEHLPKIFSENLKTFNNLAIHKTKLGYYALGTKDTTESKTTAWSLITLKKDMTVEDIIFAEDNKLQQFAFDALQMRDFSVQDDEEAKVEDLLEQYFKDIRKIKDDKGNVRYEVPLLFKSQKGKDSVPVNKTQAVGILNSNIDRLVKSGKLEEFERRCIQEHLSAGIFEEVDPAKSKEKHNFIPSYAVENPNSTTTPLRLVVAANLPKGNCINDHLLKGINLLPTIDKLIHRWRAKPIGVVGDIRKAYFMIQIRESHRRHFTILWYRNPRERKDLFAMQLAKLPMGSTNSQFQMISVFKYHIAQDHDREAGKELDDSFYSDNSVTSIEEENDFELVMRMVELMKRGGFDLCKFSTNSQELKEKLIEQGVYNLEETKSTRVLGHVWDLEKDEMCLSPVAYIDKQTWTLREILSFCHKAYDPQGLAAALLIKGTHFYSNICGKYKWNDQLSESDVAAWIPIQKEICEATTLRTPRYYQLDREEPVVMHVLVDAATNRWMGCLVYLTQHGRSVLVRGKAKLYPKSLRQSEETCPKKELAAMVVGARLYQSTREALEKIYPKLSYRLYSDSEISLAQVTNGPKDSIFVTNRVRLIRGILKDDVSLHKIKTESNTSDLVSRGIDVSVLLDPTHVYWQGPRELHEEVPVFEPSDKIAGQISLTTGQKPVSNILDMVKNCGTLYQKKRKLVTILKACHLLARRLHLKNMDNKAVWVKSQLSESQLAKLVSVILHRAEQAVTIPEVIEYLEKREKAGKSRYVGPRPDYVHPLNLWLDKNKLVRCGGRLSKAPQTFGERHPILYLRSSPLFEERVKDEHYTGLHCHTKLTQIRLFKYLWIPAGSVAIKNIVRKCVSCRAAAGPPYRNPPHANLVSCRLKVNPYSAVMVDFCGPFFTRNKEKEVTKCYVLVVICTSSRHMSNFVLSDMTAGSVLHALRRLSAVYGCPYRVFSDRATDFVKSKEVLGSKLGNEFVSEIAEKLQKKGVSWALNVSAFSPWQSGLVERAVQILKTGLKKVIGRKIMNHEEFVTVCAEISAINNDRSITHPSPNFEDPLGVCPSQLIFGRSITPMSYGETADDFDITDPEYLPQTDSELIKTWKSLARAISAYKRYFQDEWMTCLRQRHAYDAKKDPVDVPAPQAGDVVLVPKENVSRSLWERARIIKVLPSADNKPRACQLQSASGNVITRPLSKMYPILRASEMSAPQGQSQSSQVPDGDNATASNNVTTLSGPSSTGAPQRASRLAKEQAKLKTKKMIQEMEEVDD